MKPLNYYASERIDYRMRSDMRFYNFIAQSLARFIKRDWGYLDEEDREVNEQSIKDGRGMILGSYRFKDEETVFIIRDDPSADFVTILYPEER